MHDDQQETGTVSQQVAGISAEGFRHVALLAGSQEQYLAEVTGFVSAALDRGEPVLVEHGTLCPSHAYLGADGMPRPCLQPLPDPPADAEALHYQQDMQPVRALTRRRADRCGLPGDRADNLTLAVSELAANTLRHS